jgi:hypothetical protein
MNKQKQSDTPAPRFEILETLDASRLSEELKEHYKSHFLPLIQRLVPDGKKIQMVFLADPPAIELRRST